MMGRAFSSHRKCDFRRMQWKSVCADPLPFLPWLTCLLQQSLHFLRRNCAQGYFAGYFAKWCLPTCCNTQRRGLPKPVRSTATLKERKEGLYRRCYSPISMCSLTCYVANEVHFHVCFGCYRSNMYLLHTFASSQYYEVFDPHETKWPSVVRIFLIVQ